ncbi:translesion DNA synthesis-associated protein ImuA [Janthinobacterium agaricidamnosum]|uniref:Cell division inhibitor protein n=1 Tax=Janthinobacterium agaricidamnosum NBRC 102515 = DSM 9628 TaxID=1349767 RepID=W0V313_9BURK|nr:translesion DNA synthesis-associated protein ImuA [Janthinobacterium agaricidamnosum]CDG81960.1 cell division inhibitor protein [Janthinobacterium agaricidamnosum NBRC 102515 = DSM 9628]
MQTSDPVAAPEALHPSLWRASQLAHSAERCIDTGFAALSAQLPGQGWPAGNMIDLLLQQPGSGEMRLLSPALAGLSQRPIVMLQPPHPPQALALAALGLDPSQLIWIRSNNSGDALWAAENVLRSGSCGALLFWQNHVRGETLRRLHLAAQSGDTLFCMLRPLASAQHASPAPLRLSLRPAAGGIDIGFVKRRGPRRETPLFLALNLVPSHLSSFNLFSPIRHAPLDRPLSAPASARGVLPELVG